jgi:iron(III) transport system ATP-binding protein
MELSRRLSDVLCSSLGKRFVGSKGGEFAVGDSVRIVLRPESLSDREEDKINILNGKVLKYVFLGSNVEYEIELPDGKRLNAVTFNPIERKFPVVGKETELFFSKKSAWVIKS